MSQEKVTTGKKDHPAHFLYLTSVYPRFACIESLGPELEQIEEVYRRAQLPMFVIYAVYAYGMSGWCNDM